jgi:hypothetical protein
MTTMEILVAKAKALPPVGQREVLVVPIHRTHHDCRRSRLSWE